jgi:hypothetical protein
MRLTFAESENQKTNRYLFYVNEKIKIRRTTLQFSGWHHSTVKKESRAASWDKLFKKYFLSGTDRKNELEDKACNLRKEIRHYIKEIVDREDNDICSIKNWLKYSKKDVHLKKLKLEN